MTDKQKTNHPLWPVLASTQTIAPSFSNSFKQQDQLLFLDQFMKPDDLQKFHQEAKELEKLSNRSYVFAFKKSGSISYF